MGFTAFDSSCCQCMLRYTGLHLKGSPELPSTHTHTHTRAPPCFFLLQACHANRGRDTGTRRVVCLP
jgi:hypothetical protein